MKQSRHTNYWKVAT